MIHYKYFTLDNGLRVYVHEDHTTPIAAVNILYNVGSKDEDESKTGFAHLFEHLMFGGSKHVPVYDEPLQRVGGENNAGPPSARRSATSKRPRWTMSVRSFTSTTCPTTPSWWWPVRYR
jgi:hypothetical protein